MSNETIELLNNIVTGKFQCFPYKCTKCALLSKHHDKFWIGIVKCSLIETELCHRLDDIAPALQRVKKKAKEKLYSILDEEILS